MAKDSPKVDEPAKDDTYPVPGNPELDAREQTGDVPARGDKVTAPDMFNPGDKHRFHLYYERSSDDGASWFGAWVHQRITLEDLADLVEDIGRKLP